MKLTIKTFVILFIATHFTACTTLEERIKEAANLSSDHFYTTARVTDDEFEQFAQISTREGLQDRRGLLQNVNDDNFLRAFINKDTLEVQYQIYTKAMYQKKGWSHFTQVNYLTRGGKRKSSELTRIHSDVSCSGNALINCIYEEHVGFNVEEDVLLSVVEKYTPGMIATWQYKLKARDGSNYKAGIFPAEIVGLLKKVDEYIANIQL